MSEKKPTVIHSHWVVSKLQVLLQSLQMPASFRQRGGRHLQIAFDYYIAHRCRRLFVVRLNLYPQVVRAYGRPGDCIHVGVKIRLGYMPPYTFGHL